jgi:hypothetical protein
MNSKDASKMINEKRVTAMFGMRINSELILNYAKITESLAIRKYWLLIFKRNYFTIRLSTEFS